MADYVTVPASVQADAGVEANPQNGTSGEAIAAGDPVRISAADSKLYLGQADALDNADIAGIALNSAPGVNQPVQYARSGLLTLGFVAPDGTVVAVSATKGKLAPVSDLAAGSFVSLVGTMKDNKLKVGIVKSGVAKA